MENPPTRVRPTSPKLAMESVVVGARLGDLDTIVRKCFRVKTLHLMTDEISTQVRRMNLVSFPAADPVHAGASNVISGSAGVYFIP